MYNKMIIRFGFCDIRNNQGLSKCYQPQPITLTLTLIILDITKTLSNNCSELCSKRKANRATDCVILNLVFLLGGIRRRKTRFSDSSRHLQHEKCFSTNNIHIWKWFLLTMKESRTVQSSFFPSNPCLVVNKALQSRDKTCHFYLHKII